MATVISVQAHTSRKANKAAAKGQTNSGKPVKMKDIAAMIDGSVAPS